MKILLVSWSTLPNAGGSSVIVENLARNFESEELVDTVWDYDHGFGCVTTITFLDSEKYLLESAGQVVMKEFALTQHEDTEFFLLAQETIANNNQPSCAGIKAGREGSRQRAYVQFAADGQSLTFFPKPDNESPVRVTYDRRNVAPPSEAASQPPASE